MDREELQQRLHPESEREKRVRNFWLKYGVAVKIIAGMFIIAIILVSCAVFKTPSKEEAAQPPTACFKHDVCLTLEIMRTQEELEMGLSNHTSISEDYGMLFIFAESDVQRMWMKDMDFPIDIFWIDSKGRIVHIEKNAQPCVPPMCEIFEPNSLAKYVLETRAGFAKDTALYDGEKVVFSNLKNG